MPENKRRAIFAGLAAAMMLLSGCGEEPAASEQPEQSEPSAVSAAEGETKTFQHTDLLLEVPNVQEVRQERFVNDMGQSREYDVYVVAPGAMVRVLNADMMDDAADGLPHADWAFLTAPDGRIDIVDDLEPLEITEDLLGVYDPESSEMVLGFALSGDGGTGGFL